MSMPVNITVAIKNIGFIEFPKEAGFHGTTEF
jgi:hypothetical protein